MLKKELQNLPGWDLKALQHRKKAKAYSSWEPVHQIFHVLRGSFLRLQEMLSYLLRKSCKSITNSKTGPRNTRRQEQFFCKMILSAVQTTRLAFCVCRPCWCYPVTPLTTTFNWQAQTNESSVPLTASPLEFRCSTPQSYTKLSIISQSTAAALAGLWEPVAHCKLLQDTWIIYQFSDTSFLYVLLPTAMLTSKIMEYTASEDSEVAAKKFSSPDSSFQMKGSPVFVQRFVEIILWSLGSVETWSRHSSQEFKKKYNNPNPAALEVLQNHSSVKPKVWHESLFPGAKACLACVCLSDRAQRPWCCGWLLLPLELRRSQEAAATETSICCYGWDFRRRGLLVKPLPCDTSAVLFPAHDLGTDA